MSRIGNAIARRKNLIAYVTIGYPSVDTVLELVPALALWGCDAVELGIPFSDPLADGTTIQDASYRALQNGVTPPLCLDIAAQLRAKVDIPLIFMTYYNPVLTYGAESFCLTAARAGIDGLIIPDCPPEEGDEIELYARSNAMDVIYMVAPTSSEERIDLVAQQSSGFIYLVSVSGVTGTRQSLSLGLEDFVARVRARTPLPLCVGFGISTPAQAGAVAAIADGVIVGSRLIQLLEDHSADEIKEFIGGLRDAIDSS